MADLYQKEFGLTTEFIKGQGGILEVKVEGQTVWTNRDGNRDKPTDAQARQAMQDFLNRQ